jgi:hypothetical protein
VSPLIAEFQRQQHSRRPNLFFERAGAPQSPSSSALARSNTVTSPPVRLPVKRIPLIQLVPEKTGGWWRRKPFACAFLPPPRHPDRPSSPRAVQAYLRASRQQKSRENRPYCVSVGQTNRQSIPHTPGRPFKPQPVSHSDLYPRPRNSSRSVVSPCLSSGPVREAVPGSRLPPFSRPPSAPLQAAV